MPIPLQQSFERKLCHFVLAGYEAPAQFAEETKRADKVIGWGIVLSVLASCIMGFGYLVCLLFCIQVSCQSLVAPYSMNPICNFLNILVILAGHVFAPQIWIICPYKM
jgi:amino acid transporter